MTIAALKILMAISLVSCDRSSRGGSATLFRHPRGQDDPPALPLSRPVHLEARGTSRAENRLRPGPPPPAEPCAITRKLSAFTAVS